MGLAVIRYDVIVNHGLIGYHSRSDVSLSIVDLTVMGSIPCNSRQARTMNDDKETRPSPCKHAVRGLH